MNSILEQVHNALDAKMYEYKYFAMVDKTKTICTDWATESNFSDSHPGVIVLTKTLY